VRGYDFVRQRVDFKLAYDSSILSLDRNKRIVNRTLQNRGFTLIELMIALAIVAILSMVAYPSYQSAMVKNRRASAQAHLMDIAQRQEQYLIDSRAYADTVAALNLTTPSDVSSFYSITIANGATTVPSFTATATPVAGTSQAVDGPLALSNSGVKSPADKW